MFYLLIFLIHLFGMQKKEHYYLDKNIKAFYPKNLVRDKAYLEFYCNKQKQTFPLILAKTLYHRNLGL